MITVREKDGGRIVGDVPTDRGAGFTSFLALMAK